MYLVLLLFVLLERAAASNVAAAVVVGFNDTHFFGYDGPWQAIPVSVSQPAQLVNLYPGGTFATAILCTNVENFETNYSSQDFPTDSGIFDLTLANPHSEGSSQNDRFFGPDAGGVVGAVDGGWHGSEPSGLNGTGLIITDQISGLGGSFVNNVSISAVYTANYTLPDGRLIPMDVGFLSLGAQNAQVFGNFIGNMFPLNLSATGVIPSNTWGLHIGSVPLGITGSLVFGGYDKSRVIGPVSTWPSQNGEGDMYIDLLDISIGVATGGSPFPFLAMSGLLRNADNNVEAIKTRPNPTVPYLYLPGNTCKAIAAHLPVKYLSSLDLYTWDTSSPDYKTIVASPAYLAFTFQLQGNSGNMTINVPFSLLNLTLTSPLVNSPTSYFPCKSFDPKTSTTFGEYHLGRAFLQAAFIGMNWVNTNWWMAQAPGPGPQYQIPVTTSLQNDSTTIESYGDSSLWADSWKGTWTPLPDRGPSNSSSSSSNNQNPSTTQTSSPAPGGLSTGAKAGIAVGAVAGALLLLGAALYFLRQQKKTRLARRELEGRDSTIASGVPSSYANTYSDNPPSNTDASGYQKPELQDTSPRTTPFYEMSAHHSPALVSYSSQALAQRSHEIMQTGSE